MPADLHHGDRIVPLDGSGHFALCSRRPESVTDYDGSCHNPLAGDSPASGRVPTKHQRTSAKLAGCREFLTTYSPICRPMLWPTSVENR
jgi:hypothetical protein